MTKGVKRINEKVKEMRRDFSKAVVTGTRSAVEIVHEHYDRLASLWGDAANGVSGDDFLKIGLKIKTES